MVTAALAARTARSEPVEARERRSERPRTVGKNSTVLPTRYRGDPEHSGNHPVDLRMPSLREMPQTGLIRCLTRANPSFPFQAKISIDHTLPHHGKNSGTELELITTADSIGQPGRTHGFYVHSRYPSIVFQPYENSLQLIGYLAPSYILFTCISNQLSFTRR
jgi:hypothetical protein